MPISCCSFTLPDIRAILGLGMVLIAGLTILAVRWLSQVEYSGVLRVVFTVLLVAAWRSMPGW